MIFVLAQVAWVGGTALVLFLGIKYTLGLRINNEIEEVNCKLGVKNAVVHWCIHGSASIFSDERFSFDVVDQVLLHRRESQNLRERNPFGTMSRKIVARARPGCCRRQLHKCVLTVMIVKSTGILSG